MKKILYLFFAMITLSFPIKAMVHSHKKQHDQLAQDWFYAARKGVLNVIKYFLAKKYIAINTTNFIDGCTALHYAAKYGRTEVVCILLAEGADVNKVNKEKITPLQFAVMKEDVDIVEMLLDKGADPDIVNIFGFTALDYAKVNSANEEIEKILLQAKNNILLLEESQ